MRPAVAGAGLIAACAAALFWATGGLDALGVWAQDAQRVAQDRMAELLRALHAGAPGALLGLWGLCFSYGFVHAVGPGHGKLVIGAYAAGTDSSLPRLAGVAMLAAFGQAATAMALVFAGGSLLGLTRAGLEDVAQGWLDRAAMAAILVLGLWLVWRGGRALLRRRRVAQGPPVCAACGHRHGPDPAEVAQARSWRELAALVGAISLRPCTGALFVLILTWRMGLVWQGVGAVLAMALGTGLVTVATAMVAGTARRGAGILPGFGRIAPVLELSAGTMIALLALHMLNFF